MPPETPVISFLHHPDDIQRPNDPPHPRAPSPTNCTCPPSQSEGSEQRWGFKCQFEEDGSRGIYAIYQEFCRVFVGSWLKTAMGRFNSIQTYWAECDSESGRHRTRVSIRSSATLTPLAFWSASESCCGPWICSVSSSGENTCQLTPHFKAVVAADVLDCASSQLQGPVKQQSRKNCHTTSLTWLQKLLGCSCQTNCRVQVVPGYVITAINCGEASARLTSFWNNQLGAVFLLVTYYGHIVAFDVCQSQPKSVGLIPADQVTFFRIVELPFHRSL